MINPNDVSKALRLIAEEIESKSYDAIRCQSVTCHIESGVILDVTLIKPAYKMSLQFNTDLLKRELINTTEKSDKGAHGN